MTYKGTLGAAPIVLELSQPAESANAKVVGRYFYQAKGVDIPLDAGPSLPGKIILAEEVPLACPTGANDDACMPMDTGPPQTGPVWSLSASADGATLTGTWLSGDKSQPLALTRFATRPLQTNFPGMLADYADVAAGLAPLTAQTAPYDFQRMQVKLTPGPLARWGRVAFHYETDPRTGFHFPHLDAAGSTDLAAPNATLQQRHWRLNMDAFSCASMIYKAFRANDISSDAARDLAGFPQMKVEVIYLSPARMRWTEGLTFSCGGNPKSEYAVHELDLRTGRLLN